MKQKRYDIDELTQEELKQAVINMKASIIKMTNPKGIDSVKRMIKEYEERIK